MLDMASVRAAYSQGKDDASLGDLPELLGTDGVIETFGASYAQYYWSGVRDYRALTAILEQQRTN